MDAHVSSYPINCSRTPRTGHARAYSNRLRHLRAVFKECEELLTKGFSLQGLDVLWGWNIVSEKWLGRLGPERGIDWLKTEATCDRHILRQAFLASMVAVSIPDVDNCVAEMLRRERDYLPKHWQE